MNTDERIAKKLVINGQVQGVWYRASAQDQAIALGLTGWVKNHGNQEVHAFVQGSAAAIQAFIDWCYDGPERATITTITATEAAPDPQYKEFEIHAST
jgi:acylphosphatase